jgi:Ca2+:H+ antiporter
VTGWTLMVLIATVTAALVTNGGPSAWFIGMLLLTVYAVFAITLYLLPPQAS